MSTSMWQKRPSAGMREVRRELERRRKLAVAAKGRVAMKPPAVQPSPPRRSVALTPSVSPGAATMELASPRRDGVAKKCSIRPLPPHRPALSPLATPEAASKKIDYMDIGEAEKRRTAPPRRDPLIPTASTVKIPVVANRGIPRRCSAPPPSPWPCQSALIPHAPAATMKLPSSSSLHKTSEAEYSKKTSSAPIPRRCSSTSVKKGTPVKVRTLLANLPTGERFFFSRNAVTVSDAEDGYIEVLYNGNYPPDDPSRAVRVAMDRIKTMPPTQ